MIGVLALQGGFEAHVRLVEALGETAREVRTPADLAGLDALIIPGGESTSIALGIDREGLAAPLRQLVTAGTPVLGTCAGLIVADSEHLGLMDIVARRNAFGRQLHSFEADVEMPGLGGDTNGTVVRGVFIRAPWIAEHGAGVEILAEIDGHPIAARQGPVLVVAFHPELAGETRLHRWLLDQVAARRRRYGEEG